MTNQPLIEVKQGYVLVSHESGFSGNTEVTSLARRLAEVCDAAGIHRLLLDERRLTYTVGNIFDLMGMGDSLLEEMLVFRFHRVACVTSAEQMPTARDFESVARNRGMNFRAFDTLEAAERWLLD